MPEEAVSSPIDSRRRRGSVQGNLTNLDVQEAMNNLSRVGSGIIHESRGPRDIDNLPTLESLMGLEDLCFKLLSFLKLEIQGGVKALEMPHVVRQASNVQMQADVARINSRDPEDKELGELLNNLLNLKSLNQYEALIFSLISLLKHTYLLMDKISSIPSSYQSGNELSRKNSITSPPTISPKGSQPLIDIPQGNKTPRSRRGSLAMIQSFLSFNSLNSSSTQATSAQAQQATQKQDFKSAKNQSADKLKGIDESDSNQSTTKIYDSFLTVLDAVLTQCAQFIGEQGGDKIGSEDSKSTVLVMENFLKSDPSIVAKEGSSSHKGSDGGVIEKIMNSGDGQFSNQRLDLSEAQAKRLEYAALLNKIERLQKHRLDNQRATYHERHLALGNLMDSIYLSQIKSSYNDQRVTLSSAKIEEMEMNRIVKLVEKGNAHRMDNQVWKSPDQFRVQELEKVQNLLVTRMDSPRFQDEQRYYMTPQKEKEMFISGLFHRMDRMNAGTSMETQKSKNPTQIKQDNWNEIQGALDKLSSGKMSNQCYDPERRKSKATIDLVPLDSASGN